MSATGPLLVDPRVVRRVIKHQLRISGFGLHIPHDHCAVVHRDVLRRLASSQELGGSDLPDHVVLIARDDVLAPRALWRREFHGRIHLTLEAKRRSGALSDATVRARIHAIGQTEFDEIRAVLRQEDLILSSQNDAFVYIEFAAAYLENRYFSPDSVVQIFPSIHDHERILRTLLLDLSPEALLEASRPADEEPVLMRPLDALQDEDHQIESHAPPTHPPSAAERIQLAARASLAEASGNLARAAICRQRIALVAGEKNSAPALLDALARRLLGVLGEGEEALAGWLGVLEPLAQTAASWAGGALGIEARLLLDLQKACVDHEEIKRTIDVVGWATSFGRRALVRELPVVRRVNVVRHLRAAQIRAGSARIETEARLRLIEKLVGALHRADEQLREDLGPRIRGVLESVGLKPANAPERVALRKLVDELLDQAAQRGFFTFSFLRDCISRSNLKLPDLSGPGEWWRGDALLQADARLTLELDGVYRGGEVYLRALQKGSSLFFGTSVGRALTLHLLLPVLVAFVALEGVQHLVGPLGRKLFHIKHIHLLNPWSLLGLALFLYGLIHSKSFRSVSWRVARAVGRAVHAIFVGFPRWFLQLGPVHAFLHSAPVMTLWSFVLKPALVVAPLYFVMSRSLTPLQDLEASGGVFLGLTLALNTAFGIAMQERLSTGASRSWRFLSRRVIPGILAFISELSHRLVEGVDQALYAVDERLRFRKGDTRGSLVFKGFLGTIWFFVTYLVRLGINVLFEPQVNPIKHFPVVTVSHKILLPMTPSLASVFEQLGMSGTKAMSFAVPIVALIPGAVGFLVWELKGNWDLYARNRSTDLRPVLVGHHGETIGALLKPGFHSGTVPKLFASMRQAIRQGSRKAGKYREQLRDVEHAVANFFHRELSALLEESELWPHGPVDTHAIELGSNRIRVALDCPEAGPAPAVIHFEEQSGWLVASVAERGWIDALEPPQRDLLEASLAGLYRLAGVDLCREQIESQIQKKSPYDVADEGLIVWPGGDYQSEVVYALADEPRLSPTPRGKPPATPPPELDGDQLLLWRQPVPWTTWLALWKSPEATASSLPSLRRTSLLP